MAFLTLKRVVVAVMRYSDWIVRIVANLVKFFVTDLATALGDFVRSTKTLKYNGLKDVTKVWVYKALVFYWNQNFFSTYTLFTFILFETLFTHYMIKGVVSTVHCLRGHYFSTFDANNSFHLI